MVFPSNKESDNEPILENNTDHIDSENEIVHELLDVEFEQSPSQPEQTISHDQCNNDSDVTKRHKVIESNVPNSELNKVSLVK